MTGIEILGSGPAEVSQWAAYVQAQPHATIYHELVWRDIFSRSFGYRPCYLIARADCGQVVGCLPLFRVRGLLSSRLVSVPFRDRGGPLADSPEVHRALVERAIQATREAGGKFLELKSVQALPPDPSLQERRYWVLSTVELAGLDEAELLRRVGPKTRNMLRQAERAGLAAEVLPEGQGIEEWFLVYLRSQRNLGLPPLPRRFFRELLTGLGPLARVLTVRQGARTLSACILFLHRGCGMYAYSASLPESRGARPNDLMLFEVFRFLLAQGKTRLDLGSDAPAQESLLFFKRKWLARQEPIPVYTWGQVDEGAADSSHPRYRALRSLFRRLPLWALEGIGRLATRFFG